MELSEGFAIQLLGTSVSIIATKQRQSSGHDTLVQAQVVFPTAAPQGSFKRSGNTVNIIGRGLIVVTQVWQVSALRVSNDSDIRQIANHLYPNL